MSRSLWERDSIQFPRLIAEISACVDITKKDFTALCESMDLEPEQVNELFDRANAAWEKIKEKHCPVRAAVSDARRSQGLNMRPKVGGRRN
jgi:hypothetical protein